MYKSLSASPWRHAAAAAAALMLVVLAGCASDEGTKDDGSGSHEPRVLTISTNLPPASLDPARSSTQGVNFLTPVYETLIARDVDGKLQPGLATEWALSDDATELSLTLREGVTFQDGAAFDAQAVKANLDAAPNRGGQLAAQLSIVTGVDVIDDTHLTLTMSRPAADILGVLASEAGMMISPEALGSEDLGTNPVGTGPFTVAENNQTGITYQAWDGYWDADSIKLDQIKYLTGLDDKARLDAVLTGEVQVGYAIRYLQIAEQKQRAPELVAVTGSQAYAYGVMVNTAQGEWANPAMRLATQHAIDRKGISEALFGGVDGCEPVAQPYPSDFWASDPSLEGSDLANYDPALARQILENAGLIGTKVKLYVGATTLFENMAAAVQEQLNAVGLDVTVESVDGAELASLRAKGEFEASIASVQSGRPDPAQFVQQFYTPNGAFNFGHQVYEGIDEPLAAMNATGDQDERAGYMHEIMKQVLEQGPLMIPVCSATTVTMHSPKVAGIEIAINFDDNFNKAYFVDDK